jgi:hypothetical protein
LVFSLLIRRLPIANPTRTFPWDAFSQLWGDLRRLSSNLPLRRVALGIVFFWSVGALAQMNIDQFAFEGGALAETDKIPLLISLVIGVGLGSVLAGVRLFDVAVHRSRRDHRPGIGHNDLSHVGLLPVIDAWNQRRSVLGTVGSVLATPQSATASR